MPKTVFPIDNRAKIPYDSVRFTPYLRLELTDPPFPYGYGQGFGQPGQLPSVAHAARLIARKRKFYELAAS